MSGKCSARCARSVSRIQRRSSAEAKRIAREQLLLARQRLGAGDVPAHREALEEELDGALPGVLAREDVAAGDLGVLHARRRRHRAAQHEQRAVLVAVLELGRADALTAAALLRHRRDGSVPPRAQADPTARGGPRRAGAARRLAAAAAARPARRAALQRVGAGAPATGSCSSTPGMHDRGSMANLERALDQTGHRVEDVRLVVITHAHIDHCGQAPPIAERAGCEVWMHPAWRCTRRPTSTARSRSRCRAACPRSRCGAGPSAAAARAPARPERCTPTATSSPASSIETDVGAWEVVETPGHAPSHVCLHQPERRLLISGDHLLGRVSQYFDVGYTPDPVGEFLHSLDVVDALDARLALAGHARPFTDVHGHIEANRRLVARAPGRRPRRARRRPAHRLRARARGLRRRSTRRWRPGC